jgi:glycosyltransferase involved in cell wall biosynthesis
MLTSPFDTPQPKMIDEAADIIFVADMFVEDYAGGAEMTTEALISSATDLNVQKLRSQEITMALLQQGVNAHWIFGNMSGLKPDLIPSIIGNLSYSILEYDYKFCQYRSIEKHLHETGKPCDCDNELHGKMISAFFHAAKSIWWMSEEQEKRYLERFPFLAENPRCVLSSVFDDKFFQAVNIFASTVNDEDRKGWVVLGSNSWIKGAGAAEQYCKNNNLEYEIVWGLPHEELLAKLAAAEGFVYLPLGGDTCPRMVIEARALGCKLALNDNVQHKDEEWFAGEELDMLSYLYAARERFWTAIKQIMNYVPSLSGYTTVRNASEMKYPWIPTIQSMLGFCHEVVVVDGGSTDGTWEKLQAFASEEPRLVIKQINVDPAGPSFAYESDGKLKAAARDLCTSEYCWQMDADEIVHEDDYEKIKQLLRAFPKYTNLVSLPVIEYWGSTEKVRMDINPWKWRLSRNLPNITQGIPAPLLRVDPDGYEYAMLGTDSCDYIDKETGAVIPHAGFYDESVHKARIAGLSGDEEARKSYEAWFNRVVEALPGVHHYSWYNIANKIGQYKLHWGKFWKSMYRQDTEDTAENNVMFDKPWSDVTDDDITTLSKRLADEMGGWIFHEKIDFSKKVPHISVQRGHPSTFISYEKAILTEK